VLLFPAEDSPPVVRRRLEGICSAADVDFQSWPVEVITAPTLPLATPRDRERLTNSVPARQPGLLILDPPGMARAGGKPRAGGLRAPDCLAKTPRFVYSRIKLGVS
jgi:hypothetical protein